MHRKKRISRNCGGCVGLAENYVVFCRQFEIREKESVHVVAVTDISKLRRKLIGISYLGEEENTRLKAVWDERFEESDAFFINAECSENIPAILKRLFDAIRDMGYNDMAGSDFVVAGFYDLTTDVEYEADLSTLKLNLIGAEVVGFAGFAYLGRQPYQDPDMIRSRAQKLAETGNGSLCLVATHPLAKDSTDGWRAACLMLDIARRSGQLVDVFPDTRYNVGFLRYAEYDDEYRTGIQQQIAEQKKILGDNGTEAFLDALDKHISALDEDIRTSYKVDSGFQPLHPELGKEKHSIFRKKSIGSEACESTTRALRDTGENLADRICNENDISLADAKDILQKLFDEAEAGIDFAMNKEAVEKIFDRAAKGCVFNPVQLPVLTESDKLAEIKIKADWYLKECVSNAVCKTKGARIDVLRAAYEELWLDYKKKRDDINRELNNLQRRLNNTLAKDSFLNMVFVMGEAMRCCFSRSSSVDSWLKRFAVCREESDRDYISNSFGTYTGYYIDKLNGGLKTPLDEAEIKALHMSFYPCSEDVLKELMRVDE